DHFVVLYTDPDVMRYIGVGGALTRDQARQRLDFMLDHWRKHGFGMWTLLNKADGAFIGRCGLRYVEDSTEIELGYTLNKAYWGQGIATEASRGVVRYAFEVLKIGRLVALADPDHTASINVMKKVGMTFERIGLFYNSECVLYALTLLDDSLPG